MAPTGASVVPEAHELIRHKLRNGLLPTLACSATVLLWGANRPCHACDRVMALGQRGVLATFPDGDILRFHAVCFSAWDTGRREVAAA